MSFKKFKLLSPSIQIAEIDNSQTAKQADKVGPVVIGRARRGPGLTPVKVESFSEFVQIFGNPVAGGQGGDVWRDSNLTAPMYGPYAAQAYLRNNDPLTFVRLLGADHDDATTAGVAGWETIDSSGTATGLGTADNDGGAYGLFVIDSGSGDILPGVNTAPTTGSLAAIFYLNEGSLVLSGTFRSTTTTGTGSGVFIRSIGPNKEFKAITRNAASTVTSTTTFNFSETSPKYIRKVFNTNPILTNTSISLGANTASFWLGQTFERHVNDKVTGSTDQVYGVILGLKGDAGTKEGSDYRMGAQAAQTGWFFSQDTQIVSGASNSYQPQNMTKLFKFHCLDTGEWTQKNVKISIADIKASTNLADPYGTFTVLLRKADDNDNAIRVLESFSGCNLNPSSINYVGRKIGDRYRTWDDLERRYREYGNHPNNSKFVRLEMNTDVDAGGISSELLPFGVHGPLRHIGFSIIGTENQPQTFGSSVAGNDVTTLHVKGAAADIVRSAATGSDFVHIGSSSKNQNSYTGSFLFPSLALRVSSSDGNLANPTQAYFGLSTAVSQGSTRHDPGYGDYLYPLASGYNSFALSSGETENSWIFTLDDLSGSDVVAGALSHVLYLSGSRAAGTSKTANSADGYKAVLDAGFNKFTAPLFGGFDGLKIDEKEPFNNTDLEGGTETTNYAYNSIKRAIDSVADPELVECNIITVPGITNESLTSHVLTVCEDRADSLGIIDLKGGFLPGTENTSGDNAAANRGSISTTISNLLARGLNTSYGCAYYPWVQIRDSINDAILWAPPSIAALGTMANSEQKSELWFAPAGFTRGGLTQGSAGIPVIGIREQLRKKDRDDLYLANINPIAKFPAEGIVIFGQKTLQVTPSALDRINVRRLIIYIKREIARMAKTILFDPNNKVTINRFLGKVNPFMRSVKIRFGVEDFKVVFDETTTTPDVVDQNAIYGKIFVKPTKAIEHIAIDLTIASQEASFAD